MLKITNLEKKFKKNIAVDGINLELQCGNVVGLVGENGAGKTTLIKTIVGLLRKTKGEITVFDHDHTSVEAKRYFGYVPEEPMLYDYLTIDEHLQFVAQAYEIDNWKEKANKLISRFNLDEHSKKLSKDLSKGMKQKVALCSTFLVDHSFYFLDEPLIGIDPAAIFEIKKLIIEFKEIGKTILISSHLLSIVDELCDRVIIMKKGKILFDGENSELKSKVEKDNDNILEQVFLDLMNDQSN